MALAVASPKPVSWILVAVALMVNPPTWRLVILAPARLLVFLKLLGRLVKATPAGRLVGSRTPVKLVEVMVRLAFEERLATRYSMPPTLVTPKEILAPG